MVDAEKKPSAIELEQKISKGLSRPSGELILGPTRKLFRWILKWVIKPILFFAGIALAIFFVILLWRAYTTGAGQSLITNVYVALSNTPIGKLFGIVATTVGQPQKLVVSTLSWNSQVESNTNNAQLGVMISSFQPQSQRYFSGDTSNPPKVIAQITGSTLDQQSLVKVSCSMKDYPPNDIEYEPQSVNEGITFYPGKPQIFGASCIYKNGITIPASQLLLTKEATVKASYDFSTRAFLNVYTLTKNSYLQTTNPFENIQEPYLQSDNTLKSVTTAGPINLGIGLTESQPLTEDRGYLFGVTVSNNDIFGQGNIDSIKQITVQMPNDIELVPSNNCDFIYTGALPEIGSLTSSSASATASYKTYELTNNALSRFNVDCSKALSEQECISQYKDQQTFSCTLKVDRAGPQTLYVGSIKAEARYTYAVSKNTAVNIVNNPQQTTTQS